MTRSQSKYNGFGSAAVPSRHLFELRNRPETAATPLPPFTGVKNSQLAAVAIAKQSTCNRVAHDTRIRIDDANAVTTWDEFVADNLDGFSQSDFDGIRSDLIRFGRAVLGGGAAPTVTIILEPASS